MPPVQPVHDPGTDPWSPVPDAEVLETCRLDPAALAAADERLDTPWAVIRYGRLCHQRDAEGMGPNRAWSATKTLSALVAGVVAYETRSLPRTGRKTGPLTDLDRVDHWIDDFSYHPDARIAHVLAMVADSEALGDGGLAMEYDIIGRKQINSLSDILSAAIAQDPARLGGDLEAFTQKFLFGKLGLRHSSWSGGKATKIIGYSWKTDVYDMAKVGLLILRGGVWAGERILDAEWVYRMTHPAFESANTGYGYLTWLNATSGYDYGGIPSPPPDRYHGASMPGSCAPVAIYREHPHGLSQSIDCNYGTPEACAQEFDVGVWQAIGYGGQVIQGHPGLDMVLVATDLTPLDTGLRASGLLWDAVRPAVVAADPTYAGDEESFCLVYGSNHYAPDWGKQE